MMSLFDRLRVLLGRLFPRRRKPMPDPGGEAVTDGISPAAPGFTSSYDGGGVGPLAFDEAPLCRPDYVVAVDGPHFDPGDHHVEKKRLGVVWPLDSDEAEHLGGEVLGVAINHESHAPASQAAARDYTVALRAEPEFARIQPVEVGHTDGNASANAGDEPEPAEVPLSAKTTNAENGQDEASVAIDSQHNALLAASGSNGLAVGAHEADREEHCDPAVSLEDQTASAAMVTQADVVHAGEQVLSPRPINDYTDAVLVAAAGEVGNPPPPAPWGKSIGQLPNGLSVDEAVAIPKGAGGHGDLIEPHESPHAADDRTMDEADRLRNASDFQETSDVAGNEAEAQVGRYLTVEDPVIPPYSEVHAIDAEPQGLPATAGEAVQVDADPPARAAPTIKRKPGEYRPRLSRARTQRARVAAALQDTGVQHLEAALQLLIGPGDWGVELWALLRMPDGTHDEVAVELNGEAFWLGRLDEKLLEPLPLTDAAAAFGNPLLVTAAGLPVTWARSSRDLHVLSPDPHAFGFVSKPRVAIGRESVVICREELRQVALAQIFATGSPEPVRIEGPNVPSGWICWRGVRPVRPSPPIGGASILDALDPLPDVSIEFSGGIKLSNAAWLEGYPPTIRLLGSLSEGDPVLFDDEPGSQDAEGVWTADRWDAVGRHRIEHGGLTESYAIEAGEASWDWWPAWSEAVPLAGALSGPGAAHFFQATASGTLIGARPGEICTFTSREGGVALASPRFEPIWMLSGGVGIRRGGPAMIGPKVSPGAPAGSSEAVARWARAICSSRRAGANGGPERELWNRYLATARSLRKRRR